LDTNAIIDLEENRPAATSLRELVSLHLERKITLCISAIAAAERDQDLDSNREPDFSRFESKLANIGLASLELLNPTMHWGVTFWDHCVFAEEGDMLEVHLRDMLFPGVDVSAMIDPARDRRHPKALNALCDVFSMWCHIRNGGDVFVTSDSNFHKATKKQRLIALGARQILTAEEAFVFVQRASSCA
jgi:hypothetical protein